MPPARLHALDRKDEEECPIKRLRLRLRYAWDGRLSKKEGEKEEERRT